MSACTVAAADATCCVAAMREMAVVSATPLDLSAVGGRKAAAVGRAEVEAAAVDAVVAEAIVAAVVTMTAAVDAVVAEATVVVETAAMIRGQMIEDPVDLQRATEAKPEDRHTSPPRIRRKAMARAKQTGITGLQRADSSVLAEANNRAVLFLFSE